MIKKFISKLFRKTASPIPGEQPALKSGDKPSAAQRVEAINAGVYFVVAAARACGVQALTAKSLRAAADLLDGAA